MQNINEINELVKLISRLPGLGPKSAKRIVLKLTNTRDEFIAGGYAQAITFDQGGHILLKSSSGTGSTDGAVTWTTLIECLTDGRIFYGGAAAATIAKHHFNGALRVGLGNKTSTGVGGCLWHNNGSLTADNSAKELKQLTGSDGCLCIVNGQYTSNRFTDIIVLSGAGSVSVLHTLNKQGSPGARTYSKNGENVRMAINHSSAVFEVSIMGMGANEQGYTAAPGLG